MNWKDYEVDILQVDILIEDEFAEFPIKIAVDAKYLSRKVDVKCVESFISMIGDIGADQGVLITQKGYSEAAINRAHYGPQKLEIDIFNFDDLQIHQGLKAIPYSGKNSILLPAPFGWIIDNKRQPGLLACLYQRGLDLKKAQKNLEWMYLNFWHKDEKVSCIDELVEMQNKGLEARYTNLCINERRPPKRTDERNTYIRLVTSDQLPCQEITGYIDCDECIVFFVLFTKKELESRNLRKLAYILKYSEPLKIAFENTMVQSSDR